MIAGCPTEVGYWGPRGGRVERAGPKVPFYADNLNPDLRERTRAVCTRAGVKVGVLLEACTLDVAVIGREEAANVFVGRAAPVAPFAA